MSILNSILTMAAKALDLNGQSSLNGAARNGAAKNGAAKADWRELVRTAADKVTGDTRAPANNGAVDGASRVPAVAPATPRVAEVSSTATATAMSAEDRAAIKRYDYLLKTADPEQLEQVHLEAFARLTPIQREEVNAQLRAELPVGEYPASSSAADLARSATRSEARNPGFLGKMFTKPAGRGGAGLLAGAGIGAVAGVGIGAAGGLLAAVAGGAVLSSVAAPLLEQAAGLGIDFESLTGGLAGSLEGGLAELTGGLEGGLDGLTGDFAGITDGLTGSLEGLTAGVTETVSGLGAQLTELGSNFEIPGLGGLGNLFGRN